MTESEYTEFKREYTEDIKKTVIAFANTCGGSIYIGIEDNGRVSGINDIDETQLKVTNAIRSGIKPDVILFTEYHVEKINMKDVLRVDVQKGTSSPYYLSGKGLRPEGVYIRQGPSTVPASETAIFNMIRETDGNSYEDLRSTNQTLTFNTAEKEFLEREVAFGNSQQISLGIKNRDDIYTNLGFLLSDQCRRSIKVAVYGGLVKEVFQDRDEFAGSLLKQLDEAYDYIDRYNRNRAEVKGLRRIEQRDYPVEAIREALLNSLIHRDYSYNSSILISIFDDRIEFVTVGGLAKGITMEDIKLGISLSRNEKLAYVFYRLDLIESYGTGIPKIIRSYDDSHKKPKLETSDNAFKITLPNKNVHQENIVREATSPYFAEEAATPNDLYLDDYNKTVLELISSNNSITRKDVDMALGVSQPTSSRILNQLTKAGLIHKTGRGKNTRYELK